MLYPKTAGLSDKELAKIVKLYKRAYKKIVSEINGATNFGIYNRRAILAQIEIVLEKLGANVKEFIEKEIPHHYKVGADAAVKQFQRQGVILQVDEGFNVIHKEAVMALIDDTTRAFAESITGVKRSATLLLNKAVKEEIKFRMAEGVISGSALRDIKSYVKGVLQDEGLASLIDKGGRKWSLDRYTEMLIRTKTVEARNTGLVNRVAENDYDLVQVSDHQGECELCRPWEGKILSLTGKTKGYSSLAEAESSGLFHPNCRHSINVVDQAIAKKTKAYDYKTGKYT